MANMSNADLWQEVRELRGSVKTKEQQNAALMAELDKLQAELDATAAGAEALEYEIKRLQKELSGTITDKRLQQEKRLSYNRGFQEGRAK
jgi:predicted nuclease with TOPRIM domain